MQALLCLAGYDAKPIDGDFGKGTAAAVRECQIASGLTDTGIADETTRTAIGMDRPDGTKTPHPVLDRVDADLVAQMFPGTRRGNIEQNLPFVARALEEAGMDDKELVLMALATIRAETAQFVPIDEGRSKYNTSGRTPFDLYEPGTRIGRNLGNIEPGDGGRFKGRGFIQLTGRSNYEKYGRVIGLGDGLIDNPDLANDPVNASRLLAAFLKAKQARIKYAVLGGDLRMARKLVNGGSHGLKAFESTFRRGEELLARS
jgi:predicted chitinase